MDIIKNIVHAKCECGAEIMEIEYWPDEDIFCFTQFKYAPSRYSLWRRLTFLFTGRIYYNEIIIDRENTKLIADYITQNLQLLNPHADATAKS